jgi:hypothetical protein
MLRIAGLWVDLVDDVPTLDPALKRAGESVDVERILAYLHAGALVVRAPACFEDWLDPDRPLVVPFGYRTDGTWLWADEVAYYLDRHGVLPEPGLLAHMRERGYEVGEVPEAALRAAAALLGVGEDTGVQ